jgi:hypothetical protein
MLWQLLCSETGLKGQSAALQKLHNEVRTHEAVRNFDLPACNTILILYVITWFQLIFYPSPLKTHIRDGYKTESLGWCGGQMNDINCMAVSYRRAIKRKMTE